MQLKEVVRNYYTGERWFLIEIEGKETYVPEYEYKRLKKEREIKTK